MSGRPLRFFAAAALGWVTLRAVMLWPAAGPAAIPRALVPAAFADDAPKPGASPFRRQTRTLLSRSQSDRPDRCRFMTSPGSQY
jgi:hypothetical protein